VISIQSAMLVALGFFAAALIGFLLAPFYRRRAQRLAIGALKATMPLTSQEIAADKDRLRAQFALTIHRLERQMEEATHAAAKQMVEINRRDAGISALEGEVQRLRTSLEEHENARRVLEQTITERLPKVEHRLSEAKKLLFQRDREIASLTQSAQRQGGALEEATGINAQQRDEIHRLSATLTARAARNRDALSDPRFDGEVALRAEIEALRAKARDQTALINRLQGALVNTGGRPDQATAGDGNLLQNGHGNANGAGYEAEINRMRKDLADAEYALKSARGMAEAGHAGQAALEAEIRSLKATNEDQTVEVMKLKASLRAYEAEDSGDRAVKESKVALRARLSALQAQADEQTGTIQRLRAEMAAANEKLARQAQHYVEEMRRLGAGTLPASGASRSKDADKPASTLVERIGTPRPPRELRAAGKGRQTEDPLRVSGFLRALDGAAQAAANEDAQAPSGSDMGESGETAGADGAQEGARGGRRPGLLERITRVEKPA
jgi:predicted RNase H-like nuclease (RuvC/YqgF family)